MKKMQVHTICSLLLSLIAVFIAIQSYTYNKESRKLQSYLALQEYRDSFNIELLEQVNLLNCYQYHIDKTNHPLSNMLMTEINSRFEKAKYDKEVYENQSADSYLSQLYQYSWRRREIHMNLSEQLALLRAELENNPDIRELADDRCKGNRLN